MKPRLASNLLALTSKRLCHAQPLGTRPTHNIHLNSSLSCLPRPLSWHFSVLCGRQTTYPKFQQPRSSIQSSATCPGSPRVCPGWGSLYPALSRSPLINFCGIMCVAGWVRERSTLHSLGVPNGPRPGAGRGWGVAGLAAMPLLNGSQNPIASPSYHIWGILDLQNGR